VLFVVAGVEGDPFKLALVAFVQLTHLQQQTPQLHVPHPLENALH